MSGQHGPEGFGDGSFDDFIARYLQGQRAGREGRAIDIGRLLSSGTHELLGAAAAYAVEHGHAEVDALHLLRVLAGDPRASDAIRRAGGDPEAVAYAVEQRLPGDSDAAGEQKPLLTPAAQRTLFHAYQVARSSGSTYIDPEHVFFALVLAQDTPAGQILAGAGVTPESLQEAARQSVSVGAGGHATHGGQRPGETMLEKYGLDLTERARDGALDPVIGRSDEIEQAIEILSRRTKNNPVLIGDAGVGKTAIVEGLAQAIVAEEVPAPLRGTRVIALDLTAMLAGTRYRGDFEERLEGTLTEIAEHKDDLIVFVDELHTIVGAGGSGDGGTDAGNILKPRLARGELHLVGATTLREYRTIEKDAALERRFQPVHVGEPSTEDAVRILEGLKGLYEEHHGVTYTEEAIRAAVELSDRYLGERRLPDKAIDLIDQAGARLRLRTGVRTDTSALFARLAELESGKNQAVEAEHYEEAGRLRDELGEVRRRLDAARGEASGPRVVVDADQIAEVISRATGIPAQRIGESDRTRLARLEDELHERVIGQDEAVSAVARAVRRHRSGMGDERRPVGSFLFLGPTGVGKTELAKALAASLFGDEKALLRFDMSEFGERHTASRLVGAPPGYVGYDEAGELTERVRRNPYSVVLFDEIEKAHPDVHTLLLQLLDDGRMTDGQGRTVDFRNTVVIMTSNLGSEFLSAKAGALGFAAAGAGVSDSEDARARVLGRLRQEMRPEFLNRIDEVVLFRRLEEAQLHAIVRTLLAAPTGRLSALGLTLEVDESAVAWIARHGWEPEYGARPLERLIQREVDDRVADLLVADSAREGETVLVSAGDGGLTATVRPAHALAA